MSTSVPGPAPAADRVSAPRRRRAAIAATLGTMIESSDIILYSFLVVYTAPLWFPADDPATSVITALGVYAVGYFARPFGGVIFGRLGDRRGRRHTLLITLGLQGLATFSLGLIPTYATIGILAPILVIASRLVQGLAAGGEVMGAATYALESSTSSKRGLFSAATPLGGMLGIVLAPIIVGLTSLAVGPEQMAAWGWRIPFLVALVLTLGVLAFRLRIDDSPEFVELAETGRLSPTPVREAVRRHGVSLLFVVLLAVGTLYLAYTAAAYLPVYLTSVAKLSPSVAPWLTAGVIAAAAPFVVVGGLLCDRFGRTRVVASVLVVTALAAVPLFVLLSDAARGWLPVAVGYFLFAVLANLMIAGAYQGFSDAFPARVRYTAGAIGYNVGNMIGAGLGPLASAGLVRATGSPIAPSAIVVAAAVIGCAGLFVLAARRPTPEGTRGNADAAAERGSMPV